MTCWAAHTQISTHNRALFHLVINNCRKWRQATPTGHAHTQADASNSFLQCKSKCRRVREMKLDCGLCWPSQSEVCLACPACLSGCPFVLLSVCLLAVTVYCNKRNLCHELLLRRLPKRKCERSQNKWGNKAKRRRRDLRETCTASQVCVRVCVRETERAKGEKETRRVPVHAACACTSISFHFISFYFFCQLWPQICSIFCSIFCNIFCSIYLTVITTANLVHCKWHWGSSPVDLSKLNGRQREKIENPDEFFRITD